MLRKETDDNSEEHRGGIPREGAGLRARRRDDEKSESGHKTCTCGLLSCGPPECDRALARCKPSLSRGQERVRGEVADLKIICINMQSYPADPAPFRH